MHNRFLSRRPSLASIASLLLMALAVACGAAPGTAGEDRESASISGTQGSEDTASVASNAEATGPVEYFDPCPPDTSPFLAFCASDIKDTSLDFQTRSGIAFCMTSNLQNVCLSKGTCKGGGIVQGGRRGPAGVVEDMCFAACLARDTTNASAFLADPLANEVAKQNCSARPRDQAEDFAIEPPKISCTVPQGPAGYIITTVGCAGDVTQRWGLVPGATRYQLRKSSTAALLEDAPMLQASYAPLRSFSLIARACNGCGCGIWNHVKVATFNRPGQPGKPCE
jgi:hypothetical protein